MDQALLEKTLANTFKKGPTSRFRHDGRRFYIYSIYDRAVDQPGKFVIRQWEVVPEVDPIPCVGFVCESLYEARNLLPATLFNTGRSSTDHPSLLETWI